MHFDIFWDIHFAFVIITSMTGVTLLLFILPNQMYSIFLSLQDRSQLRTMLVGMGKFENMYKRRRRSPVKGRSVLNPQGVAHSNRAM